MPRYERDRGREQERYVEDTKMCSSKNRTKWCVRILIAAVIFCVPVYFIVDSLFSRKRTREEIWEGQGQGHSRSSRTSVFGDSFFGGKPPATKQPRRRRWWTTPARQQQYAVPQTPAPPTPPPPPPPGAVKGTKIAEQKEYFTARKKKFVSNASKTKGGVNAGLHTDALAEGTLTAEYLLEGRNVNAGLKNNWSTTKGSPLLEWELERTRGPKCSDNSKCSLKNGCMSTELGVCYDTPLPLRGTFSYEPNTSSVRIRPTGGMGTKKELRCSWMGNRPAAKLPDFELTEFDDPQNLLRAFKHVTGSFFQNWYDWDAPIKAVDDDDKFEMSARHEGPHGVYKIKNFCMRASGNLTGFRPNVSNFIGGNDVHPFVRDTYADFDVLVTDYLERPVKLKKKPDWYVDRKIAIMPMMGWHALHPGHALQRTGGFMSNIEDAFPLANQTGKAKNQNPDVARDDVTAMYVNIYIPPGRKPGSEAPLYYPPYCRENCSWLDYGFGPHTTLAAMSHFTTFNRGDDGFNVWATRTKAGKEASPETLNDIKKLLDIPICFKEAVVYQACYGGECYQAEDRVGHAWPLFGYKHPDVQQFVAKRFRACAAVEHLARKDGSEVQSDAPTVLYSYRKTTKSIINEETMAPVIARRILTLVPKAKLLFNEMSELSPGELIALYSTVDIVIAPYGSAFLYSFLMPSGSIGVELSFELMAISQLAGIDRQPATDYGSTFRANNGHHIAFSLTSHLGRAPYRRISFPLPLALEVADTAICAFHFAHNPLLTRKKDPKSGSSAEVDSLRGVCEVTHSVIEDHESNMTRDYDGMYLRRAIRSILPDAVAPKANRLLLMHHHAALMAKVFSWARLSDSGNTAVFYKCRRNGAGGIAKQIAATSAPLQSWLTTEEKVHFGSDSTPGSQTAGGSGSDDDDDDKGKDAKPKAKTNSNSSWPGEDGFLKAMEVELEFLRMFVSRENMVNVLVDEECPAGTVDKINQLVKRRYDAVHGKTQHGGWTDDGSVRFCGRFDSTKAKNKGWGRFTTAAPQTPVPPTPIPSQLDPLDADIGQDDGKVRVKVMQNAKERASAWEQLQGRVRSNAYNGSKADLEERAKRMMGAGNITSRVVLGGGGDLDEDIGNKKVFRASIGNYSAGPSGNYDCEQVDKFDLMLVDQEALYSAKVKTVPRLWLTTRLPSSDRNRNTALVVFRGFTSIFFPLFDDQSRKLREEREQLDRLHAALRVYEMEQVEKQFKETIKENKKSRLELSFGLGNWSHRMT